MPPLSFCLAAGLKMQRYSWQRHSSWKFDAAAGFKFDRKPVGAPQSLNEMAIPKIEGMIKHVSNRTERCQARFVVWIETHDRLKVFARRKYAHEPVSLISGPW